MAVHNDHRLTALYRDSFPDFARLVRRAGGSLEEAKDCFHDAMLIYMEKESAGTLHLYSSPKAYLLGIARVCWLRSRAAGPNLPLPDDFGEAFDPGDADRQEREETLLRSLQTAGKKCLDLLKAFYYDNISMQDIAKKFGFNGRRSATVQKYKCLEKVRAEIKTELCAAN
ncbi:MAG TPA: sigma-70 family RNA polymerase sigma factor [Puia sp.]|jgi:DNA-directed RNA polymerase specialized sigma24 family protein|uniref:RNA polymerase sigma factor n=1 Tax=Puia sp. TaxID=2045100 RepID=UPI002B935BC2|nr:sigma-70 family RNA polymerase sigma factor [Puia sp.]HVU98348.1 sigma-70 family RNA polymerase sigma factor [Puia sp.]